MKNKMATRVLTYKLGLPSYGNSKLDKYHEEDCLAWFMVNRFFRMQWRMVPFSTATNGELNDS